MQCTDQRGDLDELPQFELQRKWLPGQAATEQAAPEQAAVGQTSHP